LIVGTAGAPAFFGVLERIEAHRRLIFHRLRGGCERGEFCEIGDELEAATSPLPLSPDQAGPATAGEGDNACGSLPG
jgi:hypothetical protein